MLGYPTWFVVAQGKNPSQKPMHKDDTNLRFGCVANTFSKALTFIGVTILNNSGLCSTVLTAGLLSQAKAGGLGRGGACSLHSAVVAVNSELGSQRL